MDIAHAYATQIRFDLVSKLNGIDGIGNIEWVNWAKEKMNIPAKNRHKKCTEHFNFFCNSIIICIIHTYIHIIRKCGIKIINEQSNSNRRRLKKKRKIVRKKSTRKMSNIKRDSSIGRHIKEANRNEKQKNLRKNIK